jgi:hypothetical protein
MKQGIERKEDMAERLAAGESAEKIGAYYGVSRQRVYNIVVGDPRRSHDDAPRKTRVAPTMVRRLHRALTSEPRTLFLSIGENDWMLSHRQQPGARIVGTYSRAVSFDELQADVEHLAAEIGKEIVRPIVIRRANRMPLATAA